MKIFQKFLYFKKFKKLQNFHKISKLAYFIRLKKNWKKNYKIFIEFSENFQNFKICISWIWYFSQNWFRWDSLYKQRFTCLLSLFNGYGVNIPWVRGVDIPMVYRPPYPWYIDPPTLYNYWLLMRSTHDYADLVNERLTEANGRG